MASNYPGSLDSFDSIASDKKTSDAVGGRTHRDMHNDLGDAVEAVQAELGTDPAGTFSTVKARLDQLVAYAAKTGAYTATAADHTLNVTSGTFTLDLPAASTCTGQSLKVKNSGTGVVTLDGNSSETVEGIATFPLGPRSYVEITSTGAAWVVTGGVPDTGWRSVNGLLVNGWTGVFFLRRRDDHIVLRFLSTSPGGSGSVLTFPSGFRIGDKANTGNLVLKSGPSDDADAGAYYKVSDHTFNIFGWTDYGAFVEFPFQTNDSWPTSLPGTAA